MSKHGHTSRYYADDKDIFDLLSSGKVTVPKLHEIARSRNIFLSCEDPEDDLVKYLHVLPCSWAQLSSLVNILDSEGRPEHLTVDRVETKATIDQLREAALTVTTERKLRYGEEFEIVKHSPTFMEIKVQYSEFDYQKTRVRQRREKDVTIQIEVVDGSFEIRYEDNHVASEVIGGLVESLEKILKDAPKRKKVELSGIRVAKLRTKFFQLLMDEMPGFELYDLTDVKVERMATQAEAVEKSKADVEKDAKEKKQIESKLKRVRLTGAGLFNDPEYKKFTDSQFFISHVVWCAETSDSGSETLVEFTAEFTNSEEAKNFRYNVKGEYERAENGEYKTAKKDMNAIRRTQLNRVLENSAYQALDTVTKEATASEKVEETVTNKEDVK